MQAVESLRGGLIVSCQAPKGSPLDDPSIIAALARTAELNGARGVRINGPGHIRAVRAIVSLPILGIEKLEHPGSDVYITPTFESAQGVAHAGADIVALDATLRARPGGERIGELIPRIRLELGLPVMADVATLAEGMAAAEAGADLVATTLLGYTAETRGRPAPDYALIAGLVSRLDLPIICEGGIASPDDVRRAFDAGAYAVVAGAAITGIDRLVQRFAAAIGDGPR